MMSKPTTERKKLYSLHLNGKNIVSVEMDVPNFLPFRPNIKRQWLRGIVETQVQHALPKQPRRGPARPERRVRSAGKTVPA